MSEIAVLLTGGTIGQQDRIGGSIPDADATERLVRRCAPAGFRVRVVRVMQRDSPDISPHDWQALAHAADRELASGAQGVVVLHGTDTLAYSAAALYLALPAPTGPVVITGSMWPADAPASDAPRNLASALRVAATTDLGVCVVMGTDHFEGAAAVLDPRSVVKTRTHGDAAFSSIGFPIFGYVQDDTVTITSYPAPVLASTPSIVGFREVSDESVLSTFDNSVDIVKISPFTDPDRLQGILGGLRGVVIEGYGAGHVPKSHLDVMREFAGPVVLTTQVVTDAERLGSYASDGAILQLPNVIPAGATTSTMALVTLSWALGNGQDPSALFVKPTSEPLSNPH